MKLIDVLAENISSGPFCQHSLGNGIPQLF